MRDVAYILAGAMTLVAVLLMIEARSLQRTAHMQHTTASMGERVSFARLARQLRHIALGLAAGVVAILVVATRLL